MESFYWNKSTLYKSADTYNPKPSTAIMYIIDENEQSRNESCILEALQGSLLKQPVDVIFNIWWSVEVYSSLKELTLRD